MNPPALIPVVPILLAAHMLGPLPGPFPDPSPNPAPPANPNSPHSNRPLTGILELRPDLPHYPALHLLPTEDQDPKATGTTEATKATGTAGATNATGTEPEDSTVYLDVRPYDFAHESEPDTLLDITDAEWRRVTVEPGPDWMPDGRAVVSDDPDDPDAPPPPRGRIVIRGGMSPRRFRQAVKAAQQMVGGGPGGAMASGGLAGGPVTGQAGGQAGGPTIDPHLRALIVGGLGSRYYATREAAQGVLTRRGESAIPALVVVGLASGDLEVRDRARWALAEIGGGERGWVGVDEVLGDGMGRE